MSVFIVNQHHINVMVNSLRWMNRDDFWIGDRKFATYEKASMQEIGQTLLDENMRSFSYRYDEELEHEPFVFKLLPFNPSRYPIVQILKAVRCYEYQACESPTWEDSTALQICEIIEARCIRKLEGYDNAAWEISPPEDVAVAA